MPFLNKELFLGYNPFLNQQLFLRYNLFLGQDLRSEGRLLSNRNLQRFNSRRNAGVSHCGTELTSGTELTIRDRRLRQAQVKITSAFKSVAVNPLTNQAR